MSGTAALKPRAFQPGGRTPAEELPVIRPVNSRTLHHFVGVYMSQVLPDRPHNHEDQASSTVACTSSPSACPRGLPTSSAEDQPATKETCPAVIVDQLPDRLVAELHDLS